MTQIAFVKTTDRAVGVQEALRLLQFNALGGQRVFLKPNFNSADPFPGSTHNDSLGALIRELQARGAGRITVGDRSGMGDTRRVMEQKDIFRLAGELGVDDPEKIELITPDPASESSATEIKDVLTRR